MNKYLYDMHIATEAGDSETLKKEIAELGFKDDNLADRRLIFDPETEKHYTTCPLVIVHASKKVENHPVLRELEIDIDSLMTATNSVGYWHSECILADDHIKPTIPYRFTELPFNRLVSRPRDQEKVWDIHLSMQQSTLPQQLMDQLIASGIYYLARNKGVPGCEKRFAVFTVQGVNRLAEGKRFFTELSSWLKETGAPECDIKLELTTAMRTYLKPQAVPPTVESIGWK